MESLNGTVRGWEWTWRYQSVDNTILPRIQRSSRYLGRHEVFLPIHKKLYPWRLQKGSFSFLRAEAAFWPSTRVMGFSLNIGYVPTSTFSYSFFNLTPPEFSRQFPYHSIVLLFRLGPSKTKESFVPSLGCLDKRPKQIFPFLSLPFLSRKYQGNVSLGDSGMR